MTLFAVDLTTYGFVFTCFDFTAQWMWRVAPRLQGGPLRKMLHIYHARLGYFSATGDGAVLRKSDGGVPPVFKTVWLRGADPWAD